MFETPANRYIDPSLDPSEIKWKWNKRHMDISVVGNIFEGTANGFNSFMLEVPII